MLELARNGKSLRPRFHEAFALSLRGRQLAEHALLHREQPASAGLDSGIKQRIQGGDKPRSVGSRGFDDESPSSRVSCRPALSLLSQSQSGSTRDSCRGDERSGRRAIVSSTVARFRMAPAVKKGLFRVIVSHPS